ncbi:MAG: hypothetical protein CMJ85_05825 [Planctomycetes bacterium]|jgi:SAM-dependent methyltransferase|nr:hypothetical protein [Planctomycetota bacterium]MDP6424436.1 class I SAM-dependent methyltransferase [Planctomycetota bacterium]
MTDPSELDMKGDWNRRALENARYYIATPIDGTEQLFRSSGEHDVALFFDGLEQVLQPEATVVDIGAGVGRMDEFVAPRVRRLIGVDVSGEMVALARQRLAHLDNIEFREGDGWTLPGMDDGGIDVVFSHIVFQHMPRNVAASYFGEVVRVLAPGGHFVFQLPERVPGAPADPPESDTFEMRFYSEDELRDQLAGLGLDWVACRRFAVKSPALDFNQLRVHAQKPA